VEEMKCAASFKASRLAVIWRRKLRIAAQNNAMAPATSGVTIDVPLKFAYELSLALVDERVPAPGAAPKRCEGVSPANWIYAASTTASTEEITP
jgi:hypothetical protein